MPQPDLFSDTKRKGYKCSCCGQLVKQYARSMNCNMALAAICLYRYSNGEYVHVEKLLQEKGYQRCGDFSYLRHYHIIHAMEGSRSDGSTRNGFYRLTAFGSLFVEGKAKVSEKFLICNNHFDGFEGKEIDIKQALGVKFNYENLMNA